MPNGQIQIYKDTRSYMIDPSDYQGWAAKGWSRDKPDPKTPFINWMQASYKEPAPEKMDVSLGPGGKPIGFLGQLIRHPYPDPASIKRYVEGAGKTLADMPEAIAGAFSQPPTAQEQQPFARGGLGVSAKPGIAEKAGLGIGRMVGEPVSEAAKWYKQAATGKAGPDPLGAALSVGPEALGSATASYYFGKMLESMPENVAQFRNPKNWSPETVSMFKDHVQPLIDKVSKVTSGSHTDVLREMEDFRRTMKARPTARQRDVANIKHRALTERTNKEWTELFSNLKTQPQDALAIRRILEPLAKVDPIVSKWLEDNIVESETGESVSAPLWPKVRELSSQLNRDMGNPRLDRIHKAEIPAAHEGLEKLLKESAKAQGLDKKYAQAYQLTRKMENLKHFTGYGATPVKPSPLFGLGGAVAGIMGGEGMGVSGELGSAFIGKMIGEYFGKLVTKPGGKYRIPAKSIEAERAIWKQLGEKPPKGMKQRIIKPTGD